MKYINLNETASYKQLKETPPYDLNQLNDNRIKTNNIISSPNLSYNWAGKAVDNNTISLLADIAKEQKLIQQYKSLVLAATMNIGEKRSVGHHLTRLQDDDIQDKEAIELSQLFRVEQERAMRFADDVHSAAIRSAAGKRFDTLVHIGIGGSGLGPKLVYEALQYAEKSKQMMKFHLVSNVDPDESAQIIQQCNPETTLVLFVTKSGTTQETLSNLNAVCEMGSLDRKTQVVAITSNSSPLANSDEFLKVFHIDNSIGGRYSITSTIGAAVISLLYGRESYQDLLEGAAESDRNAFNFDIHKNASLMDAMIGIYERLYYPATAIIPYARGLSRLPAYLQQLDMESNGKQVSRRGKKVPYSTGPLIFGEPGTDAQHSFFQLLHQGTDPIPIQFIGFKHQQMHKDPVYEGSNGQTKLIANLVAQMLAFAKGKSDDAILNKNFPGGRPTSLLYSPVLNARSLGAIIAHFENKVMFQGFAWNINSFDQEGVQLGKLLTNQILEGSSKDAALDAFSLLMNDDST